MSDKGTWFLAIYIWSSRYRMCKSNRVPGLDIATYSPGVLVEMPCLEKTLSKRLK